MGAFSKKVPKTINPRHPNTFSEGVLGMFLGVKMGQNTEPQEV